MSGTGTPHASPTVNLNGFRPTPSLSNMQPSGLAPLRSCDKCFDGSGAKALHTKDPEAFATQIWPGFYIGGAHDAVREDELRRRQITHVVNLTPESRCQQWPGLEYFCVQVRDHSDAPLRMHFDVVFDWMDKARERGSGLLVHCRQGISRSATLSIGYLMRSLRIPYRLAHDVVKRRRPVINPNLGFVTALEDYEAELTIDPALPLSEFAQNLQRWGLTSPLTDEAFSPEEPSTPVSPKTGGVLGFGIEED